MENKVHFKLHKVKKQWVTIAVSGLALGASLIELVSLPTNKSRIKSPHQAHLRASAKILILSSQKQL